MKHLNALFVLCIIMMWSNASSAQIQMQNRSQIQTSGRAQLFRNVSQKVPAKISELEKAFTAKVGTNVKLHFKNFDFEGTITSTVKRYDNLYSVVIKSASLDNTLFSISKRINEDNTINYIGRIINENYADGYELVQDEEEGYVLNKIKIEVLLQDY
ncbi:MAG: hypothetical protein ABIW47_11145 [Ginsengibacter sp.]